MFWHFGGSTDDKLNAQFCIYSKRPPPASKKKVPNFVFIQNAPLGTLYPNLRGGRRGHSVTKLGGTTCTNEIGKNTHTAPPKTTHCLPPPPPPRRLLNGDYESELICGENLTHPTFFSIIWICSLLTAHCQRMIDGLLQGSPSYVSYWRASPHAEKIEVYFRYISDPCGY